MRALSCRELSDGEKKKHAENRLGYLIEEIGEVHMNNNNALLITLLARAIIEANKILELD